MDHNLNQQRQYSDKLQPHNRQHQYFAVHQQLLINLYLDQQQQHNQQVVALVQQQAVLVSSFKGNISLFYLLNFNRLRWTTNSNCGSRHKWNNS